MPEEKPVVENTVENAVDEAKDNAVAELAAAFSSAAGDAGEGKETKAEIPKENVAEKKPSVKDKASSNLDKIFGSDGSKKKKKRKKKAPAKKKKAPAKKKASSKSAVEAHEKGKRTAKQRKRFINETLYLLLKIGFALVALAAVFMMVLGAYRVSDTYMEPMVKSGDLVFFNRMDKNAAAGDVIILKYEGHDMASRVVAKGGDTVDLKDGSLIVNGNHQFEDNIYFDTEKLEEGVTFPITVPQGQYFVLGDQRKKAVDSRMFGCVGPEDIEGKLALVIRRREF